MPLTPRDDVTSEGVKTRAQRAAEASPTGSTHQATPPVAPPTPREAPPTGSAHQATPPVATPTSREAPPTGPTHEATPHVATPTPKEAPPTGPAHLTTPTGPAHQTTPPQQATPTLDLSSLMRMLDNKFSTIQEQQINAQKQQLQAQEELQRQHEHRVLSAVNEIGGAVAKLRKDFDEVEGRVSHLGIDVDSVKTGLTELEKKVVRLETKGVAVAPCSSVGANHGRPNVKLPPYDGTSSWAAYRQQFQTIATANGWTDEECLAALTAALRGKAVDVLEVLPNSGFNDLLEALESRYGEKHLEHVFRAQLRDRVQRSGEGLQQWALEIEKLVRKAYPTADVKMVESNTVQAFVDGIKDLEVRAAVRLRHHASLKEALAHALEVEAVRHDIRQIHKVREVTEEVKEIKAPFKKGSGAMCYRCGERGHLQLNCPQKEAHLTRLKKVEEFIEEERKKRDASSSKNQGNE